MPDATCRLHQIDPYDYIVNVLQRIGSTASTNSLRIPAKMTGVSG